MSSFSCVNTARAESAGSIPARRIRRLFSFQRHLLSSRLLRGTPHLNPLHILDEDYCGQARVHGRILKTNPQCMLIAQNHSFLSSFLQCMLDKVGSWNFDIFLFDRLTNGKYFDFTQVLKLTKSAKSIGNNLYKQYIIKCIHAYNLKTRLVHF